MIDLNNIKTILQIAGISRLEIGFDNNLNLVNVEFVFRGKLGTKQITQQEIIDSLTIGAPEAPDRLVVDGSFELKDLPGENEDNGLKGT